jgi:hypothetical protein
MPLSKILAYDDYSAWGEIEPGQLVGQEGREDLKHFRGAEWAQRAAEWGRPENVPAVVLVDGGKQYGAVIGDGRGRTNLAVGMGWKFLPAVILTLTKKNPDVCINHKLAITWQR